MIRVRSVYVDNRDAAEMTNCMEAEVKALRARVKELELQCAMQHEMIEQSRFWEMPVENRLMEVA